MRYLLPALLLIGSCYLPQADAVISLPKLATRPVRIATGIASNFQCSGIAIHKNWALTAGHCYSSSLWVDNIKAQFVSVPNPGWDMTVIYAPGLPSDKDITWVTKKPEVGDASILVGWGCDHQHTKARVIYAKVESVDERDLTYDQPNCAGDSGGAAFDMEGRLIGLMVRQVEENHHAVVQYLAE
jgi:V8-like Glu-specific endopeptidase